ncbi:MAG: hypothetical protein F9K16_11620 [Thermoanaerobaculia bacterium]|nr:MAG: hypothetical protein F9K16_11620 [Thermoanaerobaculia bacterium]
MGQAGEIAAGEHAGNVRVGHQIAAGIDHIGLPSLDAGVFQAYDGSWTVPFQVSVPAAAAAGQRAVVEISRGDGSALSSYLLADPWKETDGRAYLQGNTVLPPGEYRLAVGLLDVRGESSWAAERPVMVPGGAPAFWLSELILGARLSPLGRPQDLLEPYTWMSVAVPPRGGGAFAQGETLWFYAHACNVGLDAAGRPALDTELELSGKLKFHGPVEMTPARVNPGCWALAQSLDLPAATFAPGTYRLAIVVTDRTTGQRLSSARAFEIREP